MTVSAIDEVVAKHRRARIHFNELTAAVEKFLNGRTHSTFLIKHSDTEYSFRVHNVKTVPEEISLIAGDVIHNARSALDHLAFRLAIKPNHRTQFPISKSRPPNGIRLQGGASDQVTEVLELVQPYGDGINNSLLRVLHDFDIKDKHQLLLPTICAYKGASYRIDGMDTGDATVEIVRGSLENGKDVARISYRKAPDRLNGTFNVKVCVGVVDGPVKGADILNLYDNILNHVATTAHNFSSFI